MISIDNHIGTITVSKNYLISLIGHTATNCFGVSGMNFSGTKQSLFSIVDKNDTLDRGVRLITDGSRLIIDLHIIVTFGTNITAIVDSITNKVRFAVEEATGLTVKKINIFVDGMKA